MCCEAPLRLCVNFFGAMTFEVFFVSKGSPFGFIEVPPRNIRSEALYPNFRLISELYCVLLRRGRRFENSPTHDLKTALFDS